MATSDHEFGYWGTWRPSVRRESQRRLSQTPMLLAEPEPASCSLARAPSAATYRSGSWSEAGDSSLGDSPGGLRLDTGFLKPPVERGSAWSGGGIVKVLNCYLEPTWRPGPDGSRVFVRSPSPGPSPISPAAQAGPGGSQTRHLAWPEVDAGAAKAATWRSSSSQTDEKVDARPSGLMAEMKAMYGYSAEDQSLIDAWAVDEAESIEYPTKWKKAMLLFSGILPYIIGSVDHTIIVTLIPTFIIQFDQPADIGWYASSYFLPFALLMPTLGKCYTLWKIKWLFLGSLIVLIIGSVVCATSNTSNQFIAGRVLSGSGASGILQGSMRILALALPGGQRIYMEGLGALLMGACIMSGPLIGGVIADTIGWRWAFWINVPTTAFSFLVVLLSFPKESPRTPLFKLPMVEKLKRLDPVGAILLVIALSCSITALQKYSYSLSISSFEDIALVVLACLSTVLFILQEAYVRPPFALMPSTMMRRRAVWSCALLLFFLFSGFTNFVYFFSIFQQVVQGSTALESAVEMLPYLIGSTVAAGITAFGVTKVKYYNPFFILGGILFTTGFALVSRIDANIAPMTKVIYQATVGLGVGCVVLGNIAPCHIDLPEKEHPIANGVTGIGGALGACMSMPASTAYFNRLLREGLKTTDVPLSAKIAAIKNISTVADNVPPEYLGPIIETLQDAVRTTFILGVVCAAMVAVMALLVPWKPIQVSSLPTSQGDGKLDSKRPVSRSQPGIARYSIAVL